MWSRTDAEGTGADDAPVDFLRELRIAIVGLGLMGGSCALALREKCAAVLAVEPDENTRALALAQGVVDAVSASPEEILPAADVIILAAPVRTILQTLEVLPRWHPGHAVVMDIGSTKQAIVEAMDALPSRFDPIGGHPMAGKAVSGLQHAEGDLCRGAPFALTPLPRTTPRARRVAAAVVDAVGAVPLWMDAATHDRYAAAVSHAPYVLSLALALATEEEEAALAGPGFRSMTRLASSSPRMMEDILRTNRTAVLAALQRFRGTLAALETALEADDEAALRALLSQGPVRREQLLGE